jgi:DNA-directed RNA polymerase subunit RPC12/RpoP
LTIGCGRELIVDVSAMDGTVEVPALKNRLRCSKCGSRSMFVRPNWLEMRAPGMGRGDGSKIAATAGRLWGGTWSAL